MQAKRLVTSKTEPAAAAAHAKAAHTEASVDVSYFVEWLVESCKTAAAAMAPVGGGMGLQGIKGGPRLSILPPEQHSSEGELFH